jgi:predicted GIY-YIG superfamily endonuclease
VPCVVYILRCGDGSLYTGIAKDLARRLEQHRAGRASRYTRSHLPVTRGAPDQGDAQGR